MFKKNHRSSDWFFLSRCAGLAAGVVLVLLASWTQARIAPHVSVAGIPVGGLTIDQATVRLEVSWERATVSFVSSSRTWQTRAREIGVMFDAGSSARRAFAVGRNGDFGKAFAVPVTGHELAATFAVDEPMFDRYLAMVAAKFGTPPIDATLAYENGAFTVVPGHDGIMVDHKSVGAALEQRVRTGSYVPITVAPHLIQPLISASDLEPIRADAERLASIPLAVKARERIIAVSRDELGRLIVVRPLTPSTGKTVASLQPVPSPSLKALVDLDDGALRAYVERLAGEVNIASKPQQLLVSTNKIDVLDPGSVGSILAVNEAVTKLRIAIIAGSPSTVDLPIAEVAPEVTYVASPPAPVLTGKVIGVDLTKQMQYDYEDGTLVYSTKISSGINDWTPTGTFTIYSKTKKQKMSGAGYYVPNVPNILWFKGDYSLHGVYWHNDFGIRPRSHGCVGEPLTEAEWIYNWAEVGTTLVIYKS